MKITFPTFSGIRCLMMPFIQGDPTSVPDQYRDYSDIIESTYIEKGGIGYLTIDESFTKKNTPHRGYRAKFGRALHTEAGIHKGQYSWGSPVNTWGGKMKVTLDRNTQILLANNLDASCAFWDSTHEDTSSDGDIGYASEKYPYEDAVFMRAGEVHQVGILTPHESMPIKEPFPRQFLRIVGRGVHGREDYFTLNPLISMTPGMA